MARDLSTYGIVMLIRIATQGVVVVAVAVDVDVFTSIGSCVANRR